MKTEKIITLDLTARGAAMQIGETAVAGDQGSRYLVFALTQEGKPWIVPEDARAALAFATEGGCAGEYDTLPNGENAFHVEGNLVTVGLVDQILAKAGWVRLMLVLRRDLSEQLSTFPILMTVTEPIDGTEGMPGEYYRVRNLQEVNAELERFEKLTSAKLDADKLDSAVEYALAQAKESGVFDGVDGRTPVNGVDYNTPAELDQWKAWIMGELALRGQSRPEVAESLLWLQENGDPAKIYILADPQDPRKGEFFAWGKFTGLVGPGYTNRLAQATDLDRVTVYGSDYNGDGKPDGYQTKQRIVGTTGAAASASNENVCTTGLILPVALGDVIRIQGANGVANTSTFAVTYKSDNSHVKSREFLTVADGSWSVLSNQNWGAQVVGDSITFTLTEDHFGTGFDAIRFSGHFTADTVITVNEEIVQGSATITEQWTGLGISINGGLYDQQILQINRILDAHTVQISTLEKLTADERDPLTQIRNWDTPVYDAAPLLQLPEWYPSVAEGARSVAAIYAQYDDLMRKYPEYITKTDLGLCSDGATHVYRYDFREVELRHQVGMPWSEEKPTALLVSGIHGEFGGIYSLFYAMKAITEAGSEESAELRRNLHLIVVPVANPYAINGPYSRTAGVQNANGVEIHRNFEVGFKYPGDSGYVGPGDIHYGGAEPLSEPESRYLDNIMKAYPNMAFCMSCHSAQRDTVFGAGFVRIFGATEYTCNLGCRLIDKQSRHWRKKYGNTWDQGIRCENDLILADPVMYPDGRAIAATDFRAGHAQVSAANGTEARQATKYGIQAADMEVMDTFWVLSDKELDKYVTTHGAELACNYLLAYFRNYRQSDKKLYAPQWKEA